MKKNIRIITAILAVLCMSISVQAETEIIRITANGYEDILPAVHDNYVVWQGRQNGEWEIFLYDIVAAQTLQITDNDYPDLAPQTDGRYVVWLGMNYPGGNIFYYDTNSGLITQVQETGYYPIKSPPRIADGRIAWADQDVWRSVWPGDIVLYDIATGTPTNISLPTDPDYKLDDHTPVIDSTKVVWVQTDQDNIEESTVFVHDLTSGETFPAPDNFATMQSPTRDGNLSITTKFDGHDREIFLRHQRLRKNMQITDNDVEENQPKIHGNHLVWVSGLGAEQEIYLGTTRLLSPISPGDGFVSYKKSYPVFEWEAIGYDRFRVQFSFTKDFTEGETFTFPPLSDPWLYETSLTVEDESLTQWLDEISSSFYWRIVAQDPYGGNETTSQVRRIIVVTDSDGDGVADISDNCPLIANLDQANNDGDGQGDICDDDDDNDGILDSNDNCPFENSSGFDADNEGCIDNFGGLSEVINTLVTEGIIDENLANPLITKVENAEKSASKDNICAAVNQLEAFKNQIEAKRVNPLSDVVADMIIQYADNIIFKLLAKLPEGESCT